MKVLLLLSLFLYSFTIYALEESAFKNKDRYVLMKFSPVKKELSFTVTAHCYPPKGKKLNSASFIKFWEKSNNQWILRDKILPDESFDVMGDYQMSKLVKAHELNSELALEVEFIHCNKVGGGQCSMERYLGKVPRSSKVKSNELDFDLKI
jgi:hypothetical protein